MFRKIKNRLNERHLEYENSFGFERFTKAAKKADPMILCSLKPGLLAPVEKLRDYPLYLAAGILEREFDAIMRDYGLTAEVNHQLYSGKESEMHYFDIIAGTGEPRIVIEYSDVELSCMLSGNMVGKLDCLRKI